MKIKKKINILLLLCILLIGCSGKYIGYDNLENIYDKNITNNDLSLHYNSNGEYFQMAVRNISNTFMSDLTLSLECVYENGNTITDIKSLSNLKTYYYKEIIFQINYSLCTSIVLNYIYYPQADAGFMYEDRLNSIPSFSYNGIPVQDVLVIK